jgi:hypothetical protein
MRMLLKGLALTAFTVALANLPGAAMAQGKSDDQNTPNTGGVSKPGLPGKAGSKSGAAVTRQSDQSGTSTAPGDSPTRHQDESRVPGLPGNKSGPATRSPGDHGGTDSATPSR